MGHMNLKTVFVTGATGLLGNNLVRALLEQGIHVKALIRSPLKANSQFLGLKNLSYVQGDMRAPADFAHELYGCDAVFHTAAYFRENYKGGSHWDELKRINIDGTSALLECAYQAGIRNFIQTSSIAVLNGPAGSFINETNSRDLKDADDYYRSKILADEAVLSFLDKHSDMHACFVLPGWMWGPADAGPTSSGQLLLDVIKGKLPGLVPGSFSVVDARDVANALIAAAMKGRRAERYLAAGRHMTMQDFIPLLGKIANVKTPTKQMPLALLFIVASVQEAVARLTGKPILLSLATVKLMLKEANRTHFDHAKSERELGLKLRPIENTLEDTLAWYRCNGWLPMNEPTI